MFVIIPTGHSRTVWGSSWLTFGLMALCALVFLVTWKMELSSEERATEALGRLDELLQENPGAGMDPEIVEPLPLDVQAVLPLRDPDDWLDEDEGLAAEMDEAGQSLVDALMGRPAMRFGYRPAQPSILQAVSSMFVHADIWHLLGNMLFLWLTGVVIELFWGVGRALTLYLVGGLIAVLCHHLALPTSLVPLVGASGAVSAFMGAFLVGHYKERIHLWYAAWMFRVFTGSFELPAWVALPLWFGLQLTWAMQDPTGGVAYWAHVGGFAFGVVAALVADRLGWVAQPHDSHGAVSWKVAEAPRRRAMR